MAADLEHQPPPGPAPGGPLATPEENTGQALAEALHSSFVLIRILMVGLVVFFLCSGMFTVGPQEQAIILRLGKPLRVDGKVLLGPGFHWAFPPPLDEVVRIPAAQVRTAASSAGWYYTTPELEMAKNEPQPGDSLNPARDGYALTADANIIHVRATVRYSILDPVRYEFGFAHVGRFITNALNDSIHYAAAQFPVDSILTQDRTRFREKVTQRLSQLIDQQQLGIRIEQTDVQARAPRQPAVSKAFDAVTDAGLKSGQVLNEAQSYANEVRSRAFGEAASLTNAASTDKTRLVDFVGAEARQFTSLLPQYEANPGLFTLRWQTETLGRVFTNAQEKFLVAPGPDGRPRQLRLLLSREPIKPRGLPEPAPDKH
jgi:modulator of FtsH protease HflK